MSSDPGCILEIGESRMCPICGVVREAALGFPDTLEDVDDRYRTLGWQGSYCPTHAHLDPM